MRGVGVFFSRCFLGVKIVEVRLSKFVNLTFIEMRGVGFFSLQLLDMDMDMDIDIDIDIVIDIDMNHTLPKLESL